MAIDGLLVIDKPAGLTSHDVVQRVRKLLGVRRVGHGGTLDPAATGVLLVAVGQATRLFPYLSKAGKMYEGRIRLGFATDTYDSSGKPTSDELLDLPGLEAVAVAMGKFERSFLQTPPRYSAKKAAGKPAYKRARAREVFSLKPSEVSVERFQLRNYSPPHVEFEVVCSAGTYIRSLAHDLGHDLGCGGHLDALRRTSVGPYSLAAAMTLEGLEIAVSRQDIAALLQPLEHLLPEIPVVTVVPEAEKRVRNGAALAPAHLASPPRESLPFPQGAPLLRLFGRSGKLLALARPSPDGENLHPFLVIS